MRGLGARPAGRHEERNCDTSDGARPNEPDLHDPCCSPKQHVALGATRRLRGRPVPAVPAISAERSHLTRVRRDTRLPRVGGPDGTSVGRGGERKDSPARLTGLALAKPPSASLRRRLAPRMLDFRWSRCREDAHRTHVRKGIVPSTSESGWWAALGRDLFGANEKQGGCYHLRKRPRRRL